MTPALHHSQAKAAQPRVAASVTVKASRLRFAEVELSAPGLKPYQEDAQGGYQQALAEAQAFAQRHKTILSDGTVWIINSVAYGGGVAEMLPHHVCLLRDLGIDARWLVFQPDTDGFFSITKRIHNGLHDKESGLGDADWRLYDRVSQTCASDLEQIVGPGDILLVHDLQPLGAAAHYLRRHPRPAAWRCHIGYPQTTPLVEDVWRRLAPYTSDFDINVFTAPQYGRPIHKGQVFIAPTLNPFSVKNRQPRRLETIFTRKDVTEIGPAQSDEGLSPDHLARLCAAPYFLQIARWDRLKGFDTAIEAFALFCEAGADDSCQLILAGPDPRGIADDPEDVACLKYIRSCADKVAQHVRSRIHILVLSMDENDINAALVGFLQQNAFAVLQMSSQEGYGLSLTEALFKGKPVIVRDAFGLKLQILQGENGFVVSAPGLAEKTAGHMSALIRDKDLARRIGARAKEMCRSQAVQLSQITNWLHIIKDLKALRTVDAAI